MLKPLVSIITPVFNREKLIRETLDSILQQTYENWECLVVDDGSTDSTWQVLLEYKEKDPRIKPVKREREPKNGSTCRNIGMENAKGEYFIFLDSDDLLAPWSIESRMRAFEDKSFDIILSNGVGFSKKEKKYFNYTAIYGIENVLSQFLKYQVIFQTTTPTWRKDFLEKNNISWNEDALVWQDFDFHIKCFSKSPRFKWKEELPDYFLRKDKDGGKITSSKNIVSKVANNFNTYEKLIQNPQNRAELQKYFPRYMVDKLEFLLSKKDLKELLNNNRQQIQRTLGKRTFFYLKLFQKTKGVKVIHGIIFRCRYILTKIDRKKTGFKGKKRIPENYIFELKEKYKLLGFQEVVL